ncbi:hypothetical protein FGO68_gene11326 [Halteria grandinella]|uniref:Helicase C-terminal domain-containing protein n=1 Tax=Halteria grandinella TaxID=5974 RepID=A0A8J8NAW0_HALGN|nr:hypothetical protein FGO68_gene11326 [Halteria grandinella]
MSATFNIELFSNYFSKSSIKEIEQFMVYVGAEEKIRLEKEERERKLAQVWGPCKSDKDWGKDNTADQSMKEVYGEEEWVENTALALKNQLPVERRDDPASVVEINARMFPVEELYIDMLVENLLKESEITKTQQDKDLLYESRQIQEGNKPQVKEATMRVASMIICDVITRLNRFDEKLDDDKNSVLVFLPGLHEIFEFIEFIKETYDDKWVRETFDLIPLHSSLCEDEQERAFRSNNRAEGGRRKIIVATNIAESSITIPDVKYVIDFMLTKELNYDPTTKSESLILSWVSKASAKQRAGRAGRVSNGFVFRLCPKRFYENSIVEYPKPEMQRCPLEKLILQVKLWNKYEPEEILGRAIQPPDYRDIWNAIKNLQQTGALTMPPHHATEEEKKKSKITALGKIFVNLPCDLKITRLFLFGMALKCMQQAIIIGCIHQQSRSIFRTVRGGLIDQVNLTKLQCNYDNNRDSDSIMLLRIFQEWIHKFHPHLKHKAPTDEMNNARPQGGFQGGPGMMGGGNSMGGFGGQGGYQGGGMQPARDGGQNYGSYKPQFNSGRAEIQQRRVRFSRPSFGK